MQRSQTGLSNILLFITSQTPPDLTCPSLSSFSSPFPALLIPHPLPRHSSVSTCVDTQSPPTPPHRRSTALQTHKKHTRSALISLLHPSAHYHMGINYQRRAWWRAGPGWAAAWKHTAAAPLSLARRWSDTNTSTCVCVWTNRFPFYTGTH